MNMVYVVTDGHYSDYRVVGICSTLEKANRLRELYNCKNDIKEMALDDLPDVPPGLYAFVVVMDQDGNVRYSRREGCDVMQNNWKWAPYCDGKNVAFYVWARDDRHAIKIANEQRIQLIANNQWIVDIDHWNSLQNNAPE